MNLGTPVHGTNEKTIGIPPATSDVDNFIDEVLKHIFDRFSPYQTAEVAARIRIAIINHIRQQVKNQEESISTIKDDISTLNAAVKVLQTEYCEVDKDRTEQIKTSNYDRRNS